MCVAFCERITTAPGLPCPRRSNRRSHGTYPRDLHRARLRPTDGPWARGPAGQGAARPGAGWRDPASRTWRPPQSTAVNTC